MSKWALSAVVAAFLVSSGWGTNVEAGGGGKQHKSSFQGSNHFSQHDSHHDSFFVQKHHAQNIFVVPPSRVVTVYPLPVIPWWVTDKELWLRQHGYPVRKF